MDVRETLVELFYDNNVMCDQKIEGLADDVMDIIAHGVTVQEWIPVTERMPEKNDRWVLCLCVSGAIEVLKFDYTMWNWDAQYPGRCYMENYVTHWMPLPKPPKGE